LLRLLNICYLYVHMSGEPGDSSREYEIVPGRGLVTKAAIQLRLNYLRNKGFDLEHISRHFLDHSDIQNNIESFIGTVEVPLGIAGPLLFNDEGNSEYVFTAAGTLEGALVASMNRGARAISLSGGFTAQVNRQSMVRAPLFILSTGAEAQSLSNWIEKKFNSVKEVAEAYSNHARLVAIMPHLIGPHLHTRFIYTTGDAAGQNMTTTCTWHAMLWIVEHFTNDTGISINHFVIEGNGSSDKKASRFLIDHGRGTSVTASCFLEEAVIKKVLRTTAADIVRCFAPSVALAEADGMLGFNINVANAIAAIFVATGQDLGSVHESSIGILNVEVKGDGLALKLTLPSLVIGTVGGGTAVPGQKEALRLMKCDGAGQRERFAKLIAGFALSLEISTYSAIVSGEFAKAHEKLGRNKPSRWLQQNEINAEFIRNCLGNEVDGCAVKGVIIHNGLIENGILTNITRRVNKKITGFIPLELALEDGSKRKILLKSKALDSEVIKGLHLMAASIDPKLSDLIYSSRENLEYWRCHLKELYIYEFLSKKGFNQIPRFYGKCIGEEREAYLLLVEQFDKNEMLLVDAENSPQLWTSKHIESALSAINEVHLLFLTPESKAKLPVVPEFDASRSQALYNKMAEIVLQENDDQGYQVLQRYLHQLVGDVKLNGLPLTIVHNDFNPRNVAIRKNGVCCIYDWELVMINIPHRDIVEFLCFVMPDKFDEVRLQAHLDFHYHISQPMRRDIDKNSWNQGYIYALKEFLVTRASFYKVSEVLMKLKFGDRIMKNGIRMLEILENKF